MSKQLTETGTRNLWLLAIGSTAIVFGLVYLAETVTRSDIDDLWAVVTVPVTLAFFAQARRVYVRVGRVSGKVVGWTLIGLSTAVIALAFVLGLDSDVVWSISFVIAGAGAILAAWR